MSTPPFAPVTEHDVRVVTAQLSRPARDVIGIAARCACGNPTVVATKPRLGDGTPFPTLYYLCHPGATAAVSTLEATGVMAEYTDLLAESDDLRARYTAAHEAYLADRESIEHVDEIAHVTAGGMPERVKCLHALVGHALAAGPGVNPFGDLALERAAWSPEVCVCGDLVGDAEGEAAAQAEAEDTRRPDASGS
ncbi:hypothetical protein AS850_03845 [Frondihabitans sp. 762G35]|uniref:DUF501 domain-containing protein n=1 Tax=Frondihabitans sp. 762G35 TaxID=1446794 RepID=UPI000D1FF805|nr:DUF501 domain-containing protein [Frondihabitans sp. 762G35]ARC56208.1 hypothetical protein AS850_03845 [Frondihabitans sp. 762G35]